jgi:[ribosomal protein S5]-alanine N-acetyltransferase
VRSERRHPAPDPGYRAGGSELLRGRRVTLRPLQPADFEQWREVRVRSNDWLVPWEPRRTPGSPDVATDRQAFAARCRARDRERQLGSGYGYGIFVGPRFAGEININSVQRGPLQSAYVGYWIDEAQAGHGFVPEAVVVIFRFAFEELGLHRLQIAIIPRNRASRRVVEKLQIREEGLAERYLEINGVWEDHIRYAMTVEEWHQRRGELLAQWVYPDPER